MPIAPAYGGSLKVLRYLLSGGGSDIVPYISDVTMKPAFDTWDSMYWLLPNKDLFKDRILVQTQEENFDINTIDKIITKGVKNNGQKLFEKYRFWSFKPPGVQTFPTYGTGI